MPHRRHRSGRKRKRALKNKSPKILSKRAKKKIKLEIKHDAHKILSSLLPESKPYSKKYACCFSPKKVKKTESLKPPNKQTKKRKMPRPRPPPSV